MEKTLVEVLSALFGDRVFPDVAEINTPVPFCVYRQIGGDPINYLGPELPDRKNALIEIVVCTYSRQDTMRLIRRVEDALCSAPLYAEAMDGAKSVHDKETGIRAATQEFSIWDIDPQQSDAGENYTGDYLVIPSTIEQVLKTKGKIMRDDVTITAIPTYAVSNDSGTTYVIGENNGNQ